MIVHVCAFSGHRAHTAYAFHNVVKIIQHDYGKKMHDETKKNVHRCVWCCVVLEDGGAREIKKTPNATSTLTLKSFFEFKPRCGH